MGRLSARGHAVLYCCIVCMAVAGCRQPPEERALNLMREAYHYQERSESDLALEKALEAALTAPEWGQSWWMVGWVHVEREEYTKASEAFERAVQLEPDNAAWWGDLGGTELTLGRMNEARQHLEHAIELDPDNALAHAQLARLQQRSGKTAEALTSYRTALRIAPDLAVVRAELAQMLLMQQQLDEALTEARRAVDDAPELAFPHVVAGTVLVEVGRIDDALEHLRTALKIDPEDLSALTALCRVLCYSGQHATAVRLLEERADRSMPGNELWFTALRAWVAVFASDLAGAEKLAGEEYPGDQTFEERLLRAMTWVWLEEWDRAVSSVEDAITMSRRSQEAYATLDIVILFWQGCEPAYDRVRLTKSMTPGKSIIPEAILGYCLARGGDAASARSELASIDDRLSADYFEIEPAYIAGMAYRELGDIMKSDRIFQRSIDRWPKHPWSEKMREMME